ncbi:hypothetical protein DRY97_22245 [Salmonella enterica subsp. arizonae]|uniref:Uncharacterized protein n=1 Tax=Salmonella enterica TaxID=28901 RepID=A0A3J6XVV2_SALER|nr:hypothetical protein [Salmonella enterica]ECC9441018.1 hypothetical protein [Salmonella enterica subsp. arizonae]EAR3201391.1 hypothetical protein [Salmonella enterica]EBI8826732.1 hypothetical protein [Salmonella enterica]EBO4519443.1 hypothetical protein [Salmonella enterica]
MFELPMMMGKLRQRCFLSGWLDKRAGRQCFYLYPRLFSRIKSKYGAFAVFLAIFYLCFSSLLL